MHQLLATSSLLKNIFIEAYADSDTPLTSIPIRANIKWSKLLINGVPTGVSEAWGAKNPDECHTALTLENPYYTSLQITQKPSWVHPPSTYTIGSASSLVMAFEDPDGSKSRALLASHQLYIFGVKAKVRRWKKVPPKPAQHAPLTTLDDGEALLQWIDRLMAEPTESPETLKQATTEKHKLPLSSPPQPSSSGARAPKGKKKKVM
jgi:hypothetical protein